MVTASEALVELPFDKSDLERGVHNRFERVVDTFPNKIALDDATNIYTFQEINAPANRLARAILQVLGKGSEPVALFFGHSAHAVIGIYGVLKSGKFYAPLDANFPFAHNQAILEAVGARLVVTDQANISELRQITTGDTKVLILEDIDQSLSSENLAIEVSPDDLSYVIFTSGSTGKPKGVPHSHINLLYACYTGTETTFSSQDRFLFMVSYSFGASRIPLFGGLLRGAAVYYFDLKRTGFAQLRAFLLEKKITVFFTLPSVAREFFRAYDQIYTDLKVVRLSAESTARQDVRIVRAAVSKECQIIVSLGTSETNKVSANVLGENDPLLDSVIPVGYPPDGWEVLILDEHHNQLGPDEVGEIAIRSKYLSPGYWNDSELTKQKFLPAPEGEDKRIYLTGDIGLRRSDGMLRHLGRKDFQVKIRGYRVELEQIEAAIRESPNAREVVVQSQESEQGAKHLVAYIETHDGQSISSTDIQDVVGLELPMYMIPSFVVTLDSIPRTPNRKIDRTALPPVSLTRPDLDEPPLPPRNLIEAQLVQIWQARLHIDPIGVTDNFFRLGGDSLAAVNLLLDIEEYFDVRLSAEQLFLTPTVEQCAQVISQAKPPVPMRSLTKLKPEGERSPIYLLHPGGGFLLRYYHLLKYLHPDIPVQGFQAQGLDGLTEPLSEIADMAAHYVREIEEGGLVGPFHLVGFSLGGLIAYEMACQLQAAGKEAGLVCLLDSYLNYRERADIDPRKKQPRVIRLIEHDAKVVASLPQKILRTPLKDLPSILSRSLNGTIQTLRSQIFPNHDREDWAPNKLAKNTLRDSGHRYEPGVYTGDILFIKAADTMVPGAMEIWRRQVIGNVEVVEVPGRHAQLMEEPLVEQVAEIINSYHSGKLTAQR